MYVSNKLENQSSISKALNRNIDNARDLIATHSQECVNQVFRLLCLYYLPECGNATNIHSPTSICQEQCSHVKETCAPTWQAAMLAFNDIEPSLMCEDTSQLLYPLPNCCTGAGIQLSSVKKGIIHIHYNIFYNDQLSLIFEYFTTGSPSDIIKIQYFHIENL